MTFLTNKRPSNHHMTRTVREVICSKCEKIKFDKRNHTCLDCHGKLLYKCAKCMNWFENAKYSSHSPCNDIVCNLCCKSYGKQTFHQCFGKIDLLEDSLVYPLLFPTDDERPPNDIFVISWLSSLNMEIYADELIRNGFDRKETIRFLKLEHMTKMQIKIGHQLYILEQLELLK